VACANIAGAARLIRQLNPRNREELLDQIAAEASVTLH